MTPSFFSRSADIAVAGALLATFAWALIKIGPVAVARWF